MIRTSVVKLSVIPALAYRQRLSAGDTGIVIVRPDATQPGLGTISKNTGEAIPSKNTDTALFPAEAFAEAITLTAGLPWKKLGAVKANASDFAEEPAEAPADAEAVVVEEYVYQDLIDAYTDKNGKFSYELFNKALIQFAHRSTIVGRMLEAGESADDVVAYIVGNKVRAITKNEKLTDEEVTAIVDVLDSLDPKGVLKQLNAEVRRMASSVAAR